MPLPDVSFKLLLAVISTFLPEMEMSPLGAVMEIPVNAFNDTLPKADSILTALLSDEADISYNPYLSHILIPPAKALHEALSSRPSPHFVEVGTKLFNMATPG